MRYSSAILVLSLAIACGGSVPQVPEGQQVSYAHHVEPLLVKRCVGCHTAEEPDSELVLERGQGYAQLVERGSVQEPAMRLVKSGEPEASYLWRKLDQHADKGKGMPRTLFGSKRLPERELDLIRRWIEDGARP
jgi:hypothetical protein